eukprot:TRINITY_DN1239_c0_g3_i2.p1 TRINITY_DN1239_c0_g3~~TRINITY_DN1239_c0_g3_i2.p1  ORF type:complete len:182 (-),score=60.34 TRINITY_DN1239_c0_g3_i2:213-758(-)
MGRAGQTKCTKKVFGKTKKQGARKVKGAAQKPAKLRKNIVPGSVLILLAGRFRGRRVVFLKQLDSGLLLVTGPYAVNGVPLRRVNQRYCIATSAKVDLKGSDYSKVSDATFKREAEKKQKKGEAGFFADSKAKESALPEEKKAEQKKMDAAVVKALPADMKLYLKSRFSLTSNMRPHEMKF